MTCNACKLDHPPLMRCEVAKRLQSDLLAQTVTGIAPVGEVRNQTVTASVTACNQCVEKDATIEGLRNQIREMESKGRAKPNRDRAEYMRAYRARP